MSSCRDFLRGGGGEREREEDDHESEELALREVRRDRVWWWWSLRDGGVRDRDRLRFGDLSLSSLDVGNTGAEEPISRRGPLRGDSPHRGQTYHTKAWPGS